METWQVVGAVGVGLAFQVLQTIQIAIVGRQVKRTLAPPPPLAAYIPPFCAKCGALTQPSELRDGLCSECTGTGPTVPAPTKAPERPWHRRRR